MNRITYTAITVFGILAVMFMPTPMRQGAMSVMSLSAYATTAEPTDGDTTAEPTDGSTTAEPTDGNTTAEPTDETTTTESTVYTQTDMYYQSTENYGTYSESDETKIDSIEYHLRLIYGCIILSLSSVFIWFTIIKPIKKFTDF